MYDLFTAESEDSTADKHNTQKVNADAGIVLDEVLEEAPKWKVLQVSDSVFSLSVFFQAGCSKLLTQNCSNPFGKGHFLHYTRTVINLADKNIWIF
jgi:hypothetical protein